jgi:electron transport complex protein RnfC
LKINVPQRQKLALRRQLRLEREKIAREERHKKAAVQPTAKDQDAIHAALARVKEKQQATQPIVIQSGSLPDNSAVAAAREARKAQARAAQAEKQQTADEAIDPRKAAVEAAIARAKRVKRRSNRKLK